jgi:hypothetical protein
MARRPEWLQSSPPVPGYGTESRVVPALGARHREMMKRAEHPGAIHRPTRIEFTYSD